MKRVLGNPINYQADSQLFLKAKINIKDLNTENWFKLISLKTPNNQIVITFDIEIF